MNNAPQHRSVFKTIIFVLVINLTILIALAFAIEVVATFFSDKPSEVYQRSYRVNHTLAPNHRTLHEEWVARNPDYPLPYEHVTNSQAWLENYDIAVPNPPGTYRIFYLGDSFTEGTAPMDQSVWTCLGLVDGLLRPR